MLTEVMVLSNLHIVASSSFTYTYFD